MEAREDLAEGASGDSKAETGSEDAGTSKRFRFKASARLPQSTVNDGGDSTRRKRHRHHHSSHSQRKRRKTVEHGGADDPSAYDDTASQLPPDTAFRESLWDALGDDEGAAFWEGVYGQPIHSYPNTYQDQETGELEQMNEEEYAQFVRRKMWEKSWEGIEAAKEEKRRERERTKRKKEDAEERKTSSEKTAPFGYIFDLEVENSLQRGERRKEQKRWRALWDDYLGQWENLQQVAKDRTTPTADSKVLFLRNQIPWPVETGKRKDIKPDDIERFLTKCSQSSVSADEADTALMTALKLERVRWHPDKMQQRYGFMEIDQGTSAGITATFQVIDLMWNDRRTKP